MLTRPGMVWDEIAWTGLDLSGTGRLRGHGSRMGVGSEVRCVESGVWVVELVVVELYIPRLIFIDILRDDLAECVKYPTTSGTHLCPIEIYNRWYGNYHRINFVLGHSRLCIAGILLPIDSF